MSIRPLPIRPLRVLAIDPGTVCLAASLAVGGRMIKCVLSDRPDGKKWDLGWVCMAHLKNLERAGIMSVDQVWIEQMMLTTAREPTLSKAIATGNDLLQLQAVAAYIAGRLGGEIRYVTTTAWGGGLGERVTKNRVDKTLTEEERVVFNDAASGLKKDHNLYDSTGILLHATGRYRVR